MKKERILLVGPEWDAGWTQSTRKALEDLGFVLRVLHYINYNRLAVEETGGHTWEAVFENLRRRTAGRANFMTQLAGLFLGAHIGRKLLREAATFQPDLVLVLKGEWLLPGTLARLKTMPSTILATWWVDSPLLYDERHRWRSFHRCLPIYDHVFVFDLSYIDSLRKMGARSVSFLPCAADPSLYHPVDVDGEWRSSLGSRICLIGGFYPVRGEIIDCLIDEPGLAIWGAGWETFLKERGVHDPKRVWRGPWISSKEVNLAYQAAGVVFNTHHPQTKRAGLNAKAFEIPCSGAFQLMDHVEEGESLLVPGLEVVCFNSAKEAAIVAKDCLARPEMRARIAHAGHRRVMAEHTYQHRMRTLVSAIWG